MPGKDLSRSAGNNWTERERTVGDVESAGKIAFERSKVKETGVQGEFTVHPIG